MMDAPGSMVATERAENPGTPKFESAPKRADPSLSHEGVGAWLTVLATFLAAIAAMASAFAAFRQERATFTSALYAKQVDEIGLLIGRADSAKAQMNADYAAITRIDWKNSDTKEISSRMHEGLEHEMQFDTAVDQARLVLPKNAFGVLVALEEPIDRFYNKIHDIDESCIEKVEFTPSKCADSGRAILQEEIERSNITEIIIRNQLGTCAYDQLSTGQYITSETIAKCKWSKHVDLDSK